MPIMVKKSKDVIPVEVKAGEVTETYKLRWLSNAEMYGLLERYADRQELPEAEKTADQQFRMVIRNNLTYGYELLKIALIGWDGVKDEAGADVKFEKSLIGLLELQTVGEIVGKYSEARMATEKQRENEIKN